MLRLIIESNVITPAFRSRSGASFALIELVRRKWNSDAGDAALVPGIRRRAEEAGAQPPVPLLALMEYIADQLAAAF